MPTYFQAIAVAKTVGASEHLVNATHSKIGDPAILLDGRFAKLADMFRPRGTQLTVGDRLFEKSRVYAKLVRNLELIAEQGSHSAEFM